MSLRLTALELPARSGDAKGQLAQVDRLLTDGPATDLVLLPELALTGYLDDTGRFDDRTFDRSRFAEPLGGATEIALRELAQRHAVHLFAPLVERDGDRCFNTMLGFSPDGERVLHYRKRHPWMPETWATPGDLPFPLIQVGGVRVTAAICFDLHFLPLEAASELEAADLLLFASAWVDAEEPDSRTPKLQALACDFGCAVLNANWGPGAPSLHGQGGSCFIAKGGGKRPVVARAGGRVDGVVDWR